MVKKVNNQVLARQKSSYTAKPPQEPTGLVYRSELVSWLGVPETRIDWYLKQGLLPYKAVKVNHRQSRYKYSIADIRARLQQIDKLQLQGHSLKQIKAQLGDD